MGLIWDFFSYYFNRYLFVAEETIFHTVITLGLILTQIVPGKMQKMELSLLAGTAI